MPAQCRVGVGRACRGLIEIDLPDGIRVRVISHPEKLRPYAYRRPTHPSELRPIFPCVNGYNAMPAESKKTSTIVCRCLIPFRCLTSRKVLRASRSIRITVTTTPASCSRIRRSPRRLGRVAGHLLAVDVPAAASGRRGVRRNWLGGQLRAYEGFFRMAASEGQLFSRCSHVAEMAYFGGNEN
jgi:hypothetical protein